ncbi:hypothetical protein K435DRAFT_963479 [Dendrothele bispora CBS 962.96]|uniref:FAD/NAD(P)-binding domain-containing protein n=1 Tax=Dendrothele bispora (strain CBS 962.96) TaxID=1314807 RepID=A0A4S8MFU5_DENBC|nr:hypothetical protein K435DRAFT_963479 [Dendrothele bispora CBS 962.96]
MTTPTSSSTQMVSDSNANFFESSSSQRDPSYYTGDHDTTTGMTTSPLTNRKVDESSKVHSQAFSCYSIVPTTWVIIGPQPGIYLAQANLDSVLFEGFMANGFAAGGQRTATVNIENFHGFPTRILGPKLMDEFRDQSLRFGTRIITETISKIDLSLRPLRYWREGQEDEEPETADTVIVATSASAKRVGLKGGEAYWHSGIGACAVCDGTIPIFRNNPL